MFINSRQKIGAVLILIPLVFSVKDLQTKKTILCCKSSGDLYSILASLNKDVQSTASSPYLWYKRLGHTNNATLQSVLRSDSLLSNKDHLPSVCNSCILGKHIKRPFYFSENHTSERFNIIHSDIWTSPVQSINGIRYYVLFLDQHSQFLWVYPLRCKSEMFTKFLHFTSYVKTQFKTIIKAFQNDNGGEYRNSNFEKFLC